MKALKIPLLVLGAILAFSLWVDAAATRRCDDWIVCLDAAERSAMCEDWTQTRRAIDTLTDGWESWQVPLHILVPHDELDNAEALLGQCQLHAGQKDTASLCNAVSQLRCQLEVLAETEQLNLKNVL